MDSAYHYWSKLVPIFFSTSEFATQVASISELKKNPTKLINDSHGKPIAILNHNTVAAIWETWQQGDEVIHSCCLVTCDANPMMRQIHHRIMPLPLIAVPVVAAAASEELNADWRRVWC